MGDKRDRYKIPRGVKKEALQGRDLRAMHGYGGGKVTKSINRKLRYQKDVGYKTAVKIDTYYRHSGGHTTWGSSIDFVASQCGSVPR